MWLVIFRYRDDNAAVMAPSAIGVEGSVPRMDELTYKTPKAATHDSNPTY